MTSLASELNPQQKQYGVYKIHKCLIRVVTNVLEDWSWLSRWRKMRHLIRFQGISESIDSQLYRNIKQY